MSSIVLNSDGSRGQIDLQRYTPAQMKELQNNWQQFEVNQNNLARISGVPQNWNGSGMVGNAAPVPKDAWGQWAKDGIQIRRNMIGIFDDIASSTSRSVDIGVIVDHFATYSDNSKDVNVSLDGRSKAKTDQGLINYHGTPLPIFDNSVSYGWRQMATMMRDGGGAGMRDAAMRAKYRHIQEKLEDMTLNGVDGIDVGGAKVYGLLNHPKRNSRSTGVTLNGATPKAIKDEIVATIKEAHKDNFKSGFTIYLNWDDYFYMQTYQDSMSTAQGTPTATGAQRRTIAQEILNIPGVDRIVAVDSVPADTIIALVKDREVVEMLNGMPITQRVKFRANPEDDYTFLNMAAQALQLKFDDDGKMGLAVSSK